MRDGRPYPDKIKNAPRLLTGDVYFYNAYQDLSTCRLFEGGFIPWTAVNVYVRAHGGDYHDVEFLARFCGELDAMLLTEARNKTPATPTPTPDASKGRKGGILGGKGGN